MGKKLGIGPLEWIYWNRVLIHSEKETSFERKKSLMNSKAYEPEIGPVRVGMEFTDMPDAVTLIFADSGMPFNPLEKQDPDVSLPGEEREIGGLGIFMTKMIMDEMTYEYSKGQNILSMKKCFGEGD